MARKPGRNETQLPSTEEEITVPTKTTRKKATPKTVVLDGNQHVATGKTKAALQRREKTLQAQAAQPVLNKDGHRRLTAEIIQEVLHDPLAQERGKRKELAEKYNIGVGACSDVIYGCAYVRKILHKIGKQHPKGPYVPYIRPKKSASAQQ